MENPNHLKTDPDQRLAFFTKLTSTATHDLKNHLAIINENAGLMEDLALLAKDSRPLNPQRITSICAKIQARVKQADQAIKSLNHFSHTLDVPDKRLDLVQEVDHVINLSFRLVKNWGVQIQVVPVQGPILISGNPFILNQMIFRAIEVACQHACQKKTLEIRFDPKAPGLRFTAWQSAPAQDLFNGSEDQTLLKILGIQVESIDDNGFSLVWSTL